MFFKLLWSNVDEKFKVNNKKLGQEKKQREVKT